MRFNHRRRPDEGEFAPRRGGFSATPPATPPCPNSLPNNDIPVGEGELGGFSSPLCVETDIYNRGAENINFPAVAGLTGIQTPPAGAETSAKSRQSRDIMKGGVLLETPPRSGHLRLDTIDDLPGDIVSGLRLLQRQPRRSSRPEVWDVIVNDAIRLAIDGSARRAVDRGWDVDDVFGVGVRGSNDFEGLAVWLAGRQVETITEWKAVTTCGAFFFREAFGRPNSPRLPSVPLWQFGRGAQDIRSGARARPSSLAIPTIRPRTTGAST